jgi:hypothetical protein
MRTLLVAATGLVLLSGIKVINVVAAEETTTQAVVTGFTSIERMLITKYIGNAESKTVGNRVMVFNNATLKQKQEQDLPPGLAKRKDLPPGLAAQLQRNGTLPDGLAKRSLPAELEKQLPPVPPGYERSILDDMTVVLLETATRRIVDVILDPLTANSIKSR